MIWLLGGYLWLYVHRPFEVWPSPTAAMSTVTSSATLAGIPAEAPCPTSS